MGEMAEYMLNGDDCQYCGEYIGQGDGYPRSCASCAENEKPKAEKMKCTQCNKKLNGQQGLEAHAKIKHNKINEGEI